MQVSLKLASVAGILDQHDENVVLIKVTIYPVFDEGKLDLVNVEYTRVETSYV